MNILNRDTVEKLTKTFREMRLPVMAEQLMMMVESNEITTLSTGEVLERLSEAEYFSRRNNTINRLKRNAKLSQKTAHLEEIDYRPKRKINKNVIDQLESNDYIQKHRNVIILGACGTGKSFIANALGNHACENSYTAFYCRIFEFIDACNQEQLISGTISKTIRKYSKYDVLIIDDFLVNSLINKEAHYVFQLFEYRYGSKSTIVCSQLEPKEWHTNLGGEILADSILDRILSNAYELVLYGESMRSQ